MDSAEIRRLNFRKLVDERDGGEPSRAADRLSKSASQISHLIGPNPSKNIGPQIAREVEAAYGKPRGWLDILHSEDKPRAAEPPAVDASSIRVPVMNAAGSMGVGIAAPERDAVIGHMPLGREWIRRNLIISKPAALGILTAYGDSMAPTFNDGDVLLVDTGITDLKLDAVYVLEREGELFVKRVQRRPDGAFVIKSDNPLYESFTMDADAIQRMRVLGRVVWAWNGKSLCPDENYLTV